jgi:hypothetical protein
MTGKKKRVQDSITQQVLGQDDDQDIGQPYHPENGSKFFHVHLHYQ